MKIKKNYKKLAEAKTFSSDTVMAAICQHLSNHLAGSLHLWSLTSTLSTNQRCRYIYMQAKWSQYVSCFEPGNIRITMVHQ